MPHIAVFSDVICPWCFVGKRRLERALDELDLRAETTVEWLPFELNPDMPKDGMPRAQYRERKFGAERARQLDGEMTRLGEAEGIAFAFDTQSRTPSTRAAHMALAHAASLGLAEPFKEALLTAYFEQGRDVGDPAVILDIGDAVGLDREGLSTALIDERIRDRVLALERKAGEIGVSGVPFFIVEGAWAVSGAQSSEQWVAALRENGLARRESAAAL